MCNLTPLTARAFSTSSFVLEHTPIFRLSGTCLQEWSTPRLGHAAVPRHRPLTHSHQMATNEGNAGTTGSTVQDASKFLLPFTFAGRVKASWQDRDSENIGAPDLKDPKAFEYRLAM